MDDFLRNFFVKMGLARTCEAFEAEWYELKAMGKLEGSQLVPDIYQRNAVRNAVVIVWGLCAREENPTLFMGSANLSCSLGVQAWPCTPTCLLP